MSSIVVSQPMMLPWIGSFEQFRLADKVVIYDDVQLPLGRPRGFITRVEVKTAQGLRWLSIPVRHSGKIPIKDARMDDHLPWRRKHLETLRQSYSHAPFFDDMYSIAERVYKQKTNFLCDFNFSGIREVCEYFEMYPEFVLSSSLGTTAHGTQKLLDTVRLLHGSKYVSGHGALNYLDRRLLEDAGIAVELMNYEQAPYPQLHGDFIPTVTILDCIANCGQQGADYIRSNSVDWEQFADALRESVYKS